MMGHTPMGESVLVTFGKGPTRRDCGCFFTQCAEGASLRFCATHTAAPVLLEALQLALRHGDFAMTPPEQMTAIRAAIKAATA